MCNTESKPQCKPWTLSDKDVPMRFITRNKYNILLGDVDNGSLKKQKIAQFEGYWIKNHMTIVVRILLVRFYTEKYKIVCKMIWLINYNL